MASEDVIELGSSDDEAEPAAKKVKLNSMVHIPHELSGVTIAPVKPNLPSLHKKLSGRPITIKKIPNAITPSAIEGRSTRRPAQKHLGREIIKPTQKSIPLKHALNPINVKMSNVAINKVPGFYLKEPIKISKCEQTPISSLPSSITVKKAMPPHKYSGNMQNKMNKNIKILSKTSPVPKVIKMCNPIASKSSVGDVLTVELDDDDAKPETNNRPQWYLRPEEQNQREKIEKQNNMEPHSSKFIEITIEDSPVKAINNTHQIGAEFPITIEDSPIKLIADNKNHCVSEENKAVHRKPKTRKQLEYPKTDRDSPKNTVEIEIEAVGVVAGSIEANKNMVIHNDITDKDGELNSSKTNVNVLPGIDTKTNSTQESNPCHKLDKKCSGDTEFHPVYQNFIDLCFKLENSDDMQKIVEKKIKGYYRQVPKEYTESEEFIDMVSTKITSMTAGPERMYLYIKDIVDELNYKRKSFKTIGATNQQPTNDKEAENFFYGDESEFDSKRQRQIRKLEKTLKKLHRAIQKLEEQEVDFDDEEDSVYLLTERYKERMIRVHAKFCQLTNTKMPSEPRIHIEARPGQPTGPAKRLEKMINKKVPIGTPLPFPDFHDVLRCVREANEEDKLCWNEVDIMDEARDLFMRCGRKLQRRRQENEWRLAASRISAELDPAAENDELKKKLEQNKLLAVKKETELFNKYADKQNQMQLEAVEIGDKEADESLGESEDDDLHEEDMSLENTEKRKERLKRLLQEKFTKESEKSEKQSTIIPQEETQLGLNETQVTDSDVQNEQTLNIQIKSVESLNINEKTADIDEKAQSLSDNSSKMNSDMDELHLLQKLYSESEVYDSAAHSTDSGSFIAISDSLDSSSDSKKQGNEDVISIENSSYSESEANEVQNVLQVNSFKCPIQETIEKTVTSDTECTTVNKNKLDKMNNEYNDSIENVLLASSDEECHTSKKLDNRKDVHGNLNNEIPPIEQNIQKEDNIQASTDMKETFSIVENQIKETLSEDSVKQKAKGGNDLQQVERNNDKITLSKPLLLENGVKLCKETNIISTLDNNSLITSESDKILVKDKQNMECESVEEPVGSSTEAMDVVTTTSPCEN